MLLLLFLTSSIQAAEPDEDPIRLPGVFATYELPGQAAPLLSRLEAGPSLRLKPGESPDPRIPATGWRAVWTGVLEVKSPAKYRLFGRSSGPLTVSIAGRKVLQGATDRGDKMASSEPFSLDFGLHKFEVRFEPRPDPAGTWLNLFWESDEFAREPLSPMVLGHCVEQGTLDDRFAAGRLIVEEHSCVACHQAKSTDPLAGQLLTRPGPNLTNVGSRVRAGWLTRWLEHPQAIRPEAVMPRLFPSGRTGEVQRWAVARLLTGAQTPAPQRKLDAKLVAQWTKEGAEVFERTGCIVCHAAQEQVAPRATLQFLAAKTTTSALAKFLANPAETHVSGRMPRFVFPREQDPYRLALYLCSRSEDQPSKQPAPDFRLPDKPNDAELEAADAALPAHEEDEIIPWFENAKLRGDRLADAVGKHAIQAYRCANCHELRLPGDAVPLAKRFAKHSWSEMSRTPVGGCLLDDNKSPTAVAGIPRFGSAVHQQMAAVLAFLAQAGSVPGTSAPGESARLMLERLNCLGCHQRNGAGGLSTAVVNRLMAVQTEQNAEAVSPPPLTGIAGKLRASALRGVLEAHERARPWMGLQMPRYERSLVEKIPDGLAALDGDTLDDEKFRPAADPQFIEAGRTLIGDKGFSCIKCHDMLNIPNTGTRGPDLATTVERVRHDWFNRWIFDPQRMQPGTRMPSVFYGGGKRSPYPEILAGNPEHQRLALWQYLQVCRSLPAPQGLVVPQALRIPEDSRPTAVRTFLPDVSARGIALRYPSGVHVAFDTQSCRLAYAWAGGFLEMSPVWTGRGGRPARLEGPRFWESPPGFPFELITPASKSSFPDFSHRGDDPRFGADPPNDGKVYSSAVQFRSYRLKGDAFEFQYDWKVNDQTTLRIEESVSTRMTPLSTDVLRTLTTKIPEGTFLYLNVGSSDRPPVAFYDGKSLEFGPKIGGAPGSQTIMIWPGGHPLVLKNQSPRRVWMARRQGNSWLVYLTEPRTKTSSEDLRDEGPHRAMRLSIRRPIDDQEQTARKLVDLDF